MGEGGVDIQMGEGLELGVREGEGVVSGVRGRESEDSMQESIGAAAAQSSEACLR